MGTSLDVEADFFVLDDVGNMLDHSLSKTTFLEIRPIAGLQKVR